MCESVSLLAATSNQDVHQQEPTKTTEMNTGDLDGSPHPTQGTHDFIYYEDDFRYCYDDDSHLQEDDDDGAYQLLKDDDGAAHQPQEDDDETPEEHAPAPTSWLAAKAKLAEYARQKIAGVNTTSAVITGLSVVGGAVGAYFLWPAAAGVAAVGATMKAPGAAGFFISRAAFLANPQLYFQILRTAGAAAAAAAFAL